jgi:NAD(P)-dependent dehydrogenase (short-subunit alcohol dehydrogenase family)
MTSSHLGLSAIVTGGNSGIGRATAAKLMKEGARVLVVDLQTEPSWTAEHLQYFQADVAAEGSPADIIACAIDHFGCNGITWNCNTNYCSAENRWRCSRYVIHSYIISRSSDRNI